MKTEFVNQEKIRHHVLDQMQNVTHQMTQARKSKSAITGSMKIIGINYRRQMIF